jgi:hypothetical protein
MFKYSHFRQFSMDSEEFYYNEDERRRNFIIFGEDVEGYDGDNFKGLKRTDFATLINERFINPHEIQNDSPAYGVFFQFMERHPTESIFAIGYTFSPGVTIEGLEGDLLSDNALDDFEKSFSGASEFCLDRKTGKARCWYD